MPFLFRTVVGLALVTLASAQTRKLSGELAGGDVSAGRFELSPDGVYVVFSGRFQTRPANDLYVVRADGSDEPRALFPEQHFGGGGGVPNADFFRITSDSRRVVYVVDHDGYQGDELYVAPLDGRGPPLSLVQVPASFGEFQLTPDGTRVVYALRGLSSSDLEGLYSLRLDDRVRPLGEQRPIRLTEPRTAEGEVLAFQITPDSSRVVFSFTERDVACTDCDTLEPAVLFSAPLGGGESPVRLSPESRRHHLGRPPAERPSAGSLGESVSSFAINGDSERVLIVTREPFGDCATGCTFVTRLYSVPIDETSLAERPVMLFQGALAEPRLARFDRVVYLGDLDGDGLALELLSQPLYGGAPVRLHAPLAAGGSVAGFAITPDDEHVVFRADLLARGALELFSAPIDGSAEPVRLGSPLAPGRAVTDLAVSADSNYVVYRADPAVAGRFELFRAPLADRGAHARRVGAPPPEHVVPLTDEGGVLDFELHGASVLFHANEGELQHLWRVPLDARERPRRLSGDEGAGSLRVDAAATRVVYPGGIADETDVHVYAAPLEESAPSTRLDDPSSGAILGAANNFELHPDGKRVFFLATARTYARAELFVTRVDRVAPVERLANLTLDGGLLVDFRLAPAVERVAYRVLLPQADGSFALALYGAPLDGSAPGVQLTDHLSRGAADFLVAGARVVYRVAGNGQPFELFSVPLDGSASPVRLNPLPTSNGGEFVLSPDGARVVYFTNPVQSSRFELFSAPSDGSAPAVRLNGPLVSGGDVQGYRIAPDSTRVVYSADQERDNTVELYSVPIDGSAAPLKLHASQPAARKVTAFALTPDSARVVFVADHTVANRHELYAVPLDGSASPLELDPAQPNGADAGDLFLSPDGARAVYTSNATLAAQRDIRSVQTDGSGPSVRLNPPLVAGGNVRLSVDAPVIANGWVAYLADQEVDERYELFAAPLDGSAPARKLSPPLAPGGSVHWTLRAAAAGRVVFQANLDGEPHEAFELFSVPIDGSAAPVRASPPLLPGATIPRFHGTGFQLARDGRSVVYLATLDAVEVYELYQSFLGVPTRPSDPPR